MCTLNDAEFREREELVIRTLIAKTADVIEHLDGFSYFFKRDSAVMTMIRNFVSLESQCCSFLDIKIIDDESTGMIELKITADQEAKAFIAATFNQIVYGNHKVSFIVYLRRGV